jgi:drug/metabolite transporter (DMT)-like permease
LLALIAGVFYGAYQLAAGRARATLSTPVVMTLATAAGAAVLLVACLLLRAPLSGYAPRTWLMLVLLGIVSQLGGVQLINYAFGHLPTPVVSVTLLAQPPLVALLGALFLGESILPIQVLGGALVLTGIYVVHRLGRQAIIKSRE